MVTKTLERTASAKRAESNRGSLIRNEKLRQLYATMLQSRMLEERARLLASHRRLGADFAQARGHEAAEVGCTIDLHKTDVVASERHALLGNLLQGIPLPAALSQLYQHFANADIVLHQRNSHSQSSARAACKSLNEAADQPGKSSSRCDASIELARRSKKTGNIVVAFSAPAAFSEDVWHKALSAAGAESLPIIFVRRDQLWTQAGDARAARVESSGRVKSRGTRSGSELDDARLRDQGQGFPRIPVDGHDVVAVYRVAYESIQRARRGGGPTLIECQPFLPDTSGRKGSGRSIAPATAAPTAEMDPIRHMELYLSRKGLFREAWKRQLIAEFSRKLDSAIDAAQL